MSDDLKQVRRVQWKLMQRESKAKRMAWLLDIHGDWVRRLQAERQWPADAMLEMLLLTEGDEEEIDRQLAGWSAHADWDKHSPYRRNGLRDYQQFLSVLHAQHQIRIRQEIEGRDERDKALARKREAEEMLDRMGKLTDRGTRT